jgi:uncharacterized protein DUF4307
MADSSLAATSGGGVSAHDLDERYGRRPAGDRRRLLVAAVAAFVVLALAWAIWAGVSVTRATVDWRSTAVDTAAPGVVRVSVEVTQAAGRAALCSVRATDAAGAVVGWVDVAVPSSTSGTATATASVRTTRPAAGGGVVTCVRR